MTEQKRDDKLRAREAELRKIIAAQPHSHQAYQELGLIHQKRYTDSQSAPSSVQLSTSLVDVLSRERQMNEVTRNCWELFAPHRRRITSLLTQVRQQPDGELLVVGAGNCNDLDLPALTSAYSQVHLVDIDAAALRAGVAFQNVAESEPGLLLHGDLDVTGIASQLGAWMNTDTPESTQISDCVARAKTAEIALPQGVEIAVSLCVLSQLMSTINACLGGTHPQFRDLASAVRIRHLLQLAGSVRPGGLAYIISDVTSTDARSDLISASQHELPKLLDQIMKEGPFLTGANPFHIQRLCRNVPELKKRIANVRVSRPWPWYFPGRTHVVCAVEMTIAD